MKVVALLTGRGNNTLNDKNILSVLGKPLLAYPAEAAKKSQYISEFYISSENDKILEVGQNYGYKKIQRPQELAQPDSQHVDSIHHALEVIQKDGIETEILIVLLANTVSIKSTWIDSCIQEILNDQEISAVVPIYEDLDHHPFRAKKLDDQGFLKSFVDFGTQEIPTNRQDLSPCFFLCHNFWVLNMKNSVFSQNGQQPWAFMGSKVKHFLVEECIDVHDEDDIVKSEKWVMKHLDGNS